MARAAGQRPRNRQVSRRVMAFELAGIPTRFLSLVAGDPSVAVIVFMAAIPHGRTSQVAQQVSPSQVLLGTPLLSSAMRHWLVAALSDRN